MAWAELAAPTAPPLPQFPPACSMDEPSPLVMLGLPHPEMANCGTWINPMACLSHSLEPPRCSPSLRHQLRGLLAALPARNQLTSNHGGSWEPCVLPVSPPCPVTPGWESGGVPAHLLCTGCEVCSVCTASSDRGAVRLLGLLARLRVCLWSHLTREAAPDGGFV